MTVRKKLGISELVLFEFEGDKLVVKSAKESKGIIISRNCREVFE